MKLLVNKPDKQFRNECQQLELEVYNRINQQTNISLKQLIDQYKELISQPNNHINNIIQEVFPLLCAVCRQYDPNATIFDTSGNGIFAAITACKRLVLNMQLSNQERNLSILATIVVYTIQKQNIHIICNSNNEAQTLYDALNNILILIGIKSTITTKNNDVNELQKTYATEVIFGSYLDFLDNSLYLENIQTKKLIPRKVGFLTNVDTLLNHNPYCLYAELYGVKKIIGIISPMMLSQRYEIVLGYGTCNQIGKYYFSHGFGIRKVKLFDSSQTKTQIKYVKGSFVPYNTISKMTYNYNFDLNTFCNKYNNLIDQCVLAANNDIIAQKLESFRSKLAEYFAQNTDSPAKMVIFCINNENVPIEFYPSDTQSHELFTEILVISILNRATAIVWDELAQTFGLLNDYFVAVSMGKKSEVPKPNILKLLMVFGKTQDKAKSYTIDTLTNSQFNINAVR